MKFLTEATRNLFFTGKGCVGKTSLTCATAISLAERGKRVLLVSTDPVLRARQSCEQAYVREVAQHLASRTALIPWLSEPPVGPEALLAAIDGHVATAPKDASGATATSGSMLTGQNA